MNTVITCGGLGSRWNKHTGVSKHLVKINEKPLLLYTINLLNKYINYEKIYVVVNEENYLEFEIVINNLSNDKIILYKSKQNMNQIEKQHGLYSTSELFDSANNVLCMYGDVYFTENAMKIISDNLKNRNDFTIFGRKYENKYRQYGELFCFYLPKHQQENINKLVNIVYEFREKKLIKRFSGWEILSYYVADNFNFSQDDNIIKKLKDIFRRRMFGKKFINIDDETNDFDFPSDYDFYVNNNVFANVL